MKRKLFTFASALSLLLCIATVVLWTSSLHAWEELAWNKWSGTADDPRLLKVRIGATEGELLADVTRADHMPLQVKQWSSPGLTHARVPSGKFVLMLRSRWGIERTERTMYGAHYVMWQAHAPGWAIISITGLLPCVWLMLRYVRRHGKAALCCNVCGYDLRATPDRCPECGTAAAVNS